jgi:PASTA domain
MTNKLHTKSVAWLALVTATAGIAVATAQAGVPPPDYPLPDDQVCIVPDVRGLSLYDARHELAVASCTRGWTMRSYSNKVKKGGVADLAPGPGSRIKIGTEVDLIVSRGARK